MIILQVIFKAVLETLLQYYNMWTFNHNPHSVYHVSFIIVKKLPEIPVYIKTSN